MGDEKILHRAQGQATAGSAIWFLIVFGVIGALTALLVSFALPIGPWWLWLCAIVPFVWLGKWEMGRSAMVIELYERGDELRLRLSGRGAQLDEPIQRDVERWTNVVNRNIRYGGLMLSWNLVVRTTRGRRIGFHCLGGPHEDLDWPERRERLGDGPDIYSTFGVFAIEKALAAQAAARVSRGS